MPPSKLPDCNIISVNESKKYLKICGTWKCKESKYLEISNALGPLNFISINLGSLKHMQMVWKLMCMKRGMHPMTKLFG